MRFPFYRFVVFFCLCESCGGLPLDALTASTSEPDFNPLGRDAQCSAKGGQVHSLLVEWSAIDRGALEAAAKQGTVVVKYAGCELEVLPRCSAPGSYQFTALSPKQEQLRIKDEKALYAAIPIGAANLSGNLRAGNELDINLKIVGQYGLDRTELGDETISGDCASATHFVTALSVGAFELNTVRSAEAGGEASVMGAGVGGETSRRTESLRRDGEMDKCDAAANRSSEEGAPPACSAVLRVSMAPLMKGIAPIDVVVPKPKERYVSVSVGGAHVCAIRADGKAACFGDNGIG